VHGRKRRPSYLCALRKLHTFFVALLDDQISSQPLYSLYCSIYPTNLPPDLLPEFKTKKSIHPTKTQEAMRSYLPLLATLALLAAADDSSSTTSSSSATTGVPATYTHDVKVGANGLKFDPDTLTASPGDLINFHFYAANHSVAQSSFDKPCQPVEGGNGIFSGFFPVSGKEEASQVFSMRLNGTDPVWLYCAQGEHCKGGQAMVINAP
jgi:plastocyanin